jgi:hypothetical protein
MATQKDSAEDATILGDSKKSAPSGPNGSAVKSNGSKPNVDEIRTRAYEIFQERLGRNEIGDWQKAEASLAADAPKADSSRAVNESPAGLTCRSFLWQAYWPRRLLSH